MNYNSPYLQGTKRPYPTNNCQNATPYGSNSGRPGNVMQNSGHSYVNNFVCPDVNINSSCISDRGCNNGIPDCNCNNKRNSDCDCNNKRNFDCDCSNKRNSDCGCNNNTQTFCINNNKSDCEIGCNGPDKQRDAKLAGFPKAMGYVPYTSYEDVCCDANGLRQGTIFNQLIFNFMRRRCN